MNKQNGSSDIPVDLIRVVAISGVLLFHAIGYLATQTVNDVGVLQWWVVVNIYQCIGRIGVPLFIMLTGALLLTPSKKDENMSIFFKKRFSRVGLPFLFWGIIYFLYTVYIEHQPLTQDLIINGILKGPYFMFWYLYLLVGLYLLTPLLRVMIANFTDRLFKYLICLWLVGATLVPLIEFISGQSSYLQGILFLIPLCTGYFIIGPYLVKIRIKRWILVVLAILCLTLSTIVSYFTAGNGSDTMFYFIGGASPLVVIATMAIFMLLNSYTKPENASCLEKPSWQQRIMHTISENTLPIYLSHMIIIHLLQNLSGFISNNHALNPIIGVPLTAILTLLFALIIIIPLKKIPLLRKLVG